MLDPPSKALQLLLFTSRLLCHVVQLAEVGYDCPDWLSSGWFASSTGGDGPWCAHPRLAVFRCSGFTDTSSLKCCGLDLHRHSKLSCSRFSPPFEASFAPVFSHLPVWPSRPPLRSVVEASVLANRGISVQSAAARVCWEAGARVSTNQFVGDLDLPVAHEVVADGFPLVNRVDRQRQLRCGSHWRMARGQVPEAVVNIIRMGRLTAMSQT